jgi:hypothetical protein
MLDERSANALAPTLGFHEQRIQIKVAIRSRDDSREALDQASQFCDEHLAVENLLERQLDSVRVRQQSGAVV